MFGKNGFSRKQVICTAKAKIRKMAAVFCLVQCLILVFTIGFYGVAMAHPGRTDANGGHYNRKTGEYHYHNGGGSSSSSSGSRSTYTAPKYTEPTYASKVNAVSVPDEINVGERAQLEADVYPSNAEDDEITWSSENPEIATVSSVGELIAVGVGTATVVAKTSRGTSNKFTITIKEIEAESIEIKDKPTEIAVGEEKLLAAVFTPENTTYKNVEWTSADETIVKADTNGKIKGVKVGKTTITAAHKELADSFEIEVKPIKAENIRIELITEDAAETEEGRPARIEAGSTISFNAIVEPENTTDKTVIWSVSDESVAEIDQSGVVKGVGKGTVTITAVTENGLIAAYEIEVYKTSAGAAVVAVGGPILLIVWLIKRRKKKARQ